MNMGETILSPKFEKRKKKSKELNFACVRHEV